MHTFVRTKPNPDLKDMIEHEKKGTIHGNTLQHIALQCTMHHTATHGNTLQRSALH